MAFWNKTKVLVTGGAGFVGSSLTERLCDLGAGYGRSLTHVVEHDLTVYITNGVGTGDTGFF
jgi:nucleoside-diphosphate-sugar epimerase